MSDNLINVFDPETNSVGSLPQDQLQDALSQGYEVATPEQTNQFFKEQDYGSVGQQIGTAVEGLGTGVLGPLFTAGEIATGITTPEDIAGRREVNPGTHIAGQMAGLIGGGALLPEASLAGVLGKASAAAPKALGIAEGAGALSKIGSTALRWGTDAALFQAQDEVSKMMSTYHGVDPSEAVQTALVNVGLAGLFGLGGGAALGSVNPLWQATAGPKVSQFLETFTKKAGGIEGDASSALSKEITQSGLNIPPEIKAGISGDPFLESSWRVLKEAQTKPGLEASEALKTFRKDAADEVTRTFGVEPESVLSKSDLSDYQMGKKIGETLHGEMSLKSGPIAETFEKLKDKYKNLELPRGEVIPEAPTQYNVYGQKIADALPESTLPSFVDKLGDRIIETAKNEGWMTAPSSDIMKAVNKVIKDLPHQKTLNDLKNFIEQVGADTFDVTRPQLTRAGSVMKSVLRDAESDLILQQLGQEGPEIVNTYRAAQQAWKNAAKLKDALNDRLHVGGGDSIGSFLKNLGIMAKTDGEAILRRLSGKGDADVLQLLQKEFPETANALRQSQREMLLGKSVLKAGEGETLNVKHLVDQINSMSPELRDFVLTAEQRAKAEAINTLMQAASKRINTSGTAGTLDALWSNVPGTAAGLATLLTGHNPLLAGAAFYLTKQLGRDIPDAARLALLKFMGSSGPIEAGGFKAMVDFIDHVAKGEKILNNNVKNVFKAGRIILPHAGAELINGRKKLDKKLSDLQNDPESLFNIGGQTGHYLSEHQGALAQTGANVVTQVNQMRPTAIKRSPLDAEPELTGAQKQEWDRTLDIANQPLAVLQDVKDGTITPKDVLLISKLYPALYKRMTTKLGSAMIESLNKGMEIPYKTRMGLSIFMGQPLDSTMTPQGIMAAQPLIPTQPQLTQGMPKAKHSMSSLNKLAPMYATNAQARQLHRLK